MKSANDYAELFAVVGGLTRLQEDLSSLMGEVTLKAGELRKIIRGQNVAQPVDLASLHRQLAWLASDVSRMQHRVHMEVAHGR